MTIVFSCGVMRPVSRAEILIRGRIEEMSTWDARLGRRLALWELPFLVAGTLGSSPFSSQEGQERCTGKGLF
jgi:hypothetical protein